MSTESANAPTERENDLIQRIRAQCDHAGINDMRLPPRLGQIEGVVAVPELNIDAAIEGWKRSHGLPAQQDAPAPSMVGDALTVIGYTSPGSLRRLIEKEDDSLIVDEESLEGRDVPVYAAISGQKPAEGEKGC